MFKNIPIYITALLIALTAGINAYGSVVKSKNPNSILSIPFAFNGMAAENAATKNLKNKITTLNNQFPDKLQSSEVELAKKSFLNEPTAAASVLIIAHTKDTDTKLALINKAYEISRREELVVGWLTQNSIDEENLPDLLNYYDVSIRTKTAALNLLLPRIVDALSNELVIAPLYSLLAKNPPWAKQFWRAASSKTQIANNAAILREQLFNVRENKDIYSDTSLIRSLISSYNFDQAIRLRSVLLNVKDDKDSEIIVNYDFTSKPQFAPIDWQLYLNGEYGASIENDGLYLSAIRNSGGIFAQQLIKLYPEAYKVEINLMAPISSGNRVSLELQCAEDKPNKPAPVSIDLFAKSTSRVFNNKPDLCRYYWLRVNGRTSEDEDGLDTIIKSISIQR